MLGKKGGLTHTSRILENPEEFKEKLGDGIEQRARQHITNLSISWGNAQSNAKETLEYVIRVKARRRN